MKLSILTATYNREKYLQRLYDSILKNSQTSKLEAEWIIIDDGSTDGTKNLINELQHSALKQPNNIENRIQIKYIYQQNSGKMAAINRGTRETTGELIIDCDSDDFFAEKAFKIIEKNAPKLLQNQDLYALCFLKQDTFNRISGKKFKTNYMQSTMFNLYFKEDIGGEKILVFNSKIRKRFRHKLEKNEKFVTEARMYHKMDKDYKILCINEPIEVGDYIDDGYTKNINKTFKENPNGYYKYFKEILQKGLKGMKFKKKIYVIKHFIVFSFLKRKNIKFCKKEPTPTKKNRHRQKRTDTN